MSDASAATAPRPGGRGWKRLALLAVVAAVVVLFFVLGGPRWLSFEALESHRARLLEFTGEHYLGMMAACVLGYVLLTALSIPDAVIFSMAIGLLFGRWVGTAMVVVAATTGATLAFLGARYLFADAARRRMGPRLQRLARGFEEDAFNYLLFLRLVPLFPFWLVNLVPALTPVTARTFVLATALGIIPGSFVFCNLGARLATVHSGGELLDRDTLLALGLLAALSLIPVVWKKLRPRALPGAEP